MYGDVADGNWVRWDMTNGLWGQEQSDRGLSNFIPLIGENFYCWFYTAGECKEEAVALLFCIDIEQIKLLLTQKNTRSVISDQTDVTYSFW